MVYAPAAGRGTEDSRLSGRTSPGPEGLLDLGKTDSHVRGGRRLLDPTSPRVRVGQQAAITSDLFPGKLLGTVETVGTTFWQRAKFCPSTRFAFADARSL